MLRKPCFVTPNTAFAFGQALNQTPRDISTKSDTQRYISTESDVYGDGNDGRGPARCDGVALLGVARLTLSAVPAVATERGLGGPTRKSDRFADALVDSGVRRPLPPSGQPLGLVLGANEAGGFGGVAGRASGWACR